MTQESHLYQAYYCEENVWQLCQHPAIGDRPCQAVFVSNPHKTCALWYQRAAPSPDAPVVWDYHVILLRQEPTLAWQVWDLDTTLGMPLSLPHYLQRTFWATHMIEARFAPLFRVIPKDLFLETFSSDRSHMQGDDQQYLQPPPPWPPPQRPRTRTNLMRFVDMQDPFVGEIMTLTQLQERF